MVRLCDGGPVIAVDVSDAEPPDLDPGYASTASGWAILGRKLNPFRSSAKVPGIFDLITRCTVVGSRVERERSLQHAALYLEPPVAEFGTMAFDRYEEIYRAGYDYTKERLKEWNL